MRQVNEYVDVETKISDKIAQVEQNRRRKFTDEEKAVAHEMFMSGFLFGVQWMDNKTF